MEKSDTSVSSLGLSLSVLGATFLLLSSMAGPFISEKIITAPLTSNSRYGVTFPALEYISNQDEPSVIAIGSSIIQAATDGACISDGLSNNHATVYNLGISGGNPYTEMLQIPALIRAKPALVMLDLGPNGLWDYYDSEDLNEYVQFRFTINSASMSTQDIGNWTSLIREQDRQWLAFTYEEKMRLQQTYSVDATESYLGGFIDDWFESLDFEPRAPGPDDENWKAYLMSPNYREPFFEKKSAEEIQDYLDNAMAKKSKQGVYNPKESGTLNHRAYDYMIQELRSADIPVLLVATPHHPLVNSFLGENQLDGFNKTFERFVNESGVFGANMYWETWHSSMFRDRNHLGAVGREYFCERISETIDELLSSGNLTSVKKSHDVNLSSYLEDACSGSNRGYTISRTIEFIQAEGYTDCAYGDGIGYFDRWTFEPGDNSQGSGHLHALPEDVSQYKGDVKGARLDYEINFKRDGEYFVWVKMKGNSYGNDTIELAWKPSTDSYQSSVRYSSYGWTSEGQWEWEPEFNPSPLSDYFLVNETYTLSIWMNEDGVEIDEILITTLVDLNPSGVDPYKIQHQDLVCHNSPGLNIINSTNVASIEAEYYDDCAQGLAQSNQHRWVIQDDHEASGGQFVRSLPDNLVHMKDEIRGPSLFYEILFSETGTYYVWISTRGNSYGNDTLEYGIKLGDEYHGLVVSSFAWDSKGQWEWEPQTTQGPLVVSVEEVGLAQLILYMREDGVSVDRFLVTANEDFNPNIEVT